MSTDKSNKKEQDNGLYTLLADGDLLNKFRNDIKEMDSFSLEEETETVIYHMIKNTYNNKNYRLKVLICYLEYIDRGMIDKFKSIYNYVACS